MVEFTLPANSKVQEGINHPVKEVSEKPKKVVKKKPAAKKPAAKKPAVKKKTTKKKTK